MRVADGEIAEVARGAAVWLTLRDDEGRVGRGEACPMPGRSIDDAATSKAALELAAPALAGVSIDARAAVAEQIARALAPFDAALEATPTARFALETALLDLAARERRVPIAELLGGPRPYHSVAMNALVWMRAGEADDEVVARARAACDAGARALKIKFPGRDDAAFARGVEAAAAVRAALPDVELRVDLAGALALDRVERQLAALAPLGLRYVEQPVAAEALFELGATPVPWCADDSLDRPGAAERLARVPACAAFVVKPAFVGLLRARFIAELALSRGIPVVVTHGADGPVGLAAACELALSLSRRPLACGLVPHARLAEFPACEVRHVRTPGIVTPSDLPGLGLGHVG
jgi:L-alanine-DL-glutamate epimerase-like enolase superfamily enzyme